MFRYLPRAAFALALSLSAPAFAQQQVLTPSHLAAGRAVVVATGIAQTFDGIYVEFRERVRQTAMTRPEVTKDLNEVLDALKAEFDKKRDEMIQLASQVFASRMSEADLKDTAAFFTSPVGLRYNNARPQAINDIFTQLQPWSIQTSNFLFDRVGQDMRKRGHQF